MKAAAALDSFANITFGFATLLISDCFEDVTVTTVTVSQTELPIYRRVPNDESSSASYNDHSVHPGEAVPSALNLTTGDTGHFLWFVIFMLTVCFATVVFACAGVNCIRLNRANALVVANSVTARNKNSQFEDILADGTTLDIPIAGAYSRTNRLFSPGRGGRSHGRQSGATNRTTAAETRAALNVNPIAQLYIDRSGTQSSMQDFDVLTSGTDTPGFSVSSPSSWGVAANPMYAGADHAPRLSALDFGVTYDTNEDEFADDDPSFWHRTGRPGSR